LKDCKYIEGKNCKFEKEMTHEDCMLCIPNVMILHVNILLESVCEMNVKFGQARNIYTAFNEIKKTQKGIVKLMNEAYPEAAERARVPNDGSSRMNVV